MPPPAEAGEQSQRYRRRNAFFLAAGLTAAIWALSPLLTGRKEPWDANGPYYFVALAVTGAIAVWPIPKHLKFHYLGAIAGQLVFGLVFIGMGGLFPLGVVVLAVFALIFLAAAALTLRVKRALSDRSPAT